MKQRIPCAKCHTACMARCQSRMALTLDLESLCSQVGNFCEQRQRTLPWFSTDDRCVSSSQPPHCTVQALLGVFVEYRPSGQRPWLTLTTAYHSQIMHNIKCCLTSLHFFERCLISGNPCGVAFYEPAVLDNTSPHQNTKPSPGPAAPVPTLRFNARPQRNIVEVLWLKEFI
jgi:hypothetical protein